MRFHHIVQHIVGQIEEDHGAQCEQGDPQVIADTRGQGTPHEVAHHQYADQQFDVEHVERDDEQRKEHHHDCHPETGQQDPQEVLMIVAIDTHQTCREYLNQQEYREFSNRRGRIGYHRIGIANAHHEVDDHRHTRKEDTARHALTVEHQEEGQIDQCGTRLTLQHDKEHRYEDHSQSTREVLPLLDVIAIDTHQFRQRQCRGKLRKLSRLQA